MPKFKPTQAELTAYKRSGLGTTNAYISLSGSIISRGGKPALLSSLPREHLRTVYRKELQEGQKQKLVAFLEKPNDPFGKQHIKNEQVRHIRAGVSPGVLKDVYGFAWGAKDLTRTLHNESVWTMGTNSAGKTNFSHKYLPDYSLTNTPDNAYSSLAEVGKELLEMADGKRNSVTVDMPVVREQMSLLVYLLELLPRSNHWVIQAGPEAQALRVEDDARAKVAEEEARLNERMSSEHVRVQERRDWHAYRRGRRFRNGKGQWTAGESRYPSQRRGGGSDCGSTMDWHQAGVVLPPTSLLYLLPPLVPPPTPLAGVTSGARAAASAALISHFRKA
jgi:hypothetical protein